MAILRKVRPSQLPKSWEEFLATEEPYSIALDGYVKAPPMFAPDIPMANFDHHPGVSRLETRATCAQVHLNIQCGLMLTFWDEDGVHVVICVIDCDEDVIWSIELIEDHRISVSVTNPIMNACVSVIDHMDTTGGMFPLPVDSEIMRKLAHAHQPYRFFRQSGQIDRRDPDEFNCVIDEVQGRIRELLAGRGGEATMDIKYREMGRGPGWIMIQEVGPYGRQGALLDGHKAFISARQRADGRWAYSIGRTSIWVPFPVPRLYGVLSQADDGQWNGSDIIGGSDLIKGSSLDPAELEKIINGELIPKAA